MRRQKTDRQAVSILRNYFNRVELADKDANLNMNPLTSASWAGNSFSTGAGTINWNALFGVPVGVKAVFVHTNVRDSSPVINAGRLTLKAKPASANSYITYTTAPSDLDNYENGLVPVAADGTSAYTIVASGVGTCDVWIRVIGWVKP